jgi:hypothetical protein
MRPAPMTPTLMAAIYAPSGPGLPNAARNLVTWVQRVSMIHNIIERRPRGWHGDHATTAFGGILGHRECSRINHALSLASSQYGTGA